MFKVGDVIMYRNAVHDLRTWELTAEYDGFFMSKALGNHIDSGWSFGFLEQYMQVINEGVLPYSHRS